MSRQIALDCISLKSTPRWGHTEYSLGYHTEYIRKKLGHDPANQADWNRFYDLMGMDFHWSNNDGLHGNWKKRGRATDMGHAEYAADGSDMTQPKACPFEQPEEVWDFDAVKEYGLPSEAEQVADYERFAVSSREESPDQLTTGGYYKTLVSGAIEAFGWDMLLLGLSEPARMEKPLDSFFRFTKFHMDCWAKTSIEVVIQHDDFVWTEGPFMQPEIYRKMIIPRYAELWKPLKRAGKKVLFCSDANFMQFAGDVLNAGADGLIFEPCNDFEFMVDRFGGTHALVGSCVDCRDMTFASWDKVRRTVDRSLELASRCKGVILAVGNHIPANVPDDMLDRYIEYVKANWTR